MFEAEVPASRSRRARHDGSLRWRADRRAWELRYHSLDGRPVSRTWRGGADDETGARRELRRLMAERDGGRPDIERGMTLGRWLALWLGTIDVAPSSLRNYEDVVRLYLAPDPLARVRLVDLTYEHIALALARVARRPSRQRPGRALSRHTVGHVRRVLGTALADAERSRRILANPLAGRRTRRAGTDPQDEIVPPTPAQLGAILRASAGHPYHAIYAVAIGTGMRRGEVLGLRWRDLDLDAGIAWVRHSLDARGHLGPTKTHRSRRPLALPAYAITALRERRRQQLATASAGPDGLVFTTRTGRALSARNVNRTFGELLLSHAIVPPADAPREHFRFHDLRHAVATILIAGNRPMAEVQAVLGHASIGQTNAYTHLTSSDAAAATMERALGMNAGEQSVAHKLPESVPQTGPQTPGRTRTFTHETGRGATLARGGA